jgi:hypothetical protein
LNLRRFDDDKKEENDSFLKVNLAPPTSPQFPWRLDLLEDGPEDQTQAYSPLKTRKARQAAYKQKKMINKFTDY